MNLELAKEPRNALVKNPDLLAPTTPWSEMCDEHFVQFYEDDDVLLESIAGFVGEGLRQGENAIVIATKSHRDALAELLEDGGVDLVEARRRCQYHPLDAAETLSKFLVNGLPDEKRFRSTVGELIARATQGGTALRAFGEMVALFWAEGNVAGAIRLEELWNNLHQEYKFSLFCAYPMRDFGDEVRGMSFPHVCDVHSRVIAPPNCALESLLDDRLRTIDLLQQKAALLEAEIARRKRVEEALRESQEKLASFAENAAIGLHWVDADGIILWANAAEMDLLGYSKEEYIGQNISEFHTDKERVEDILARLKRGEKLRDYEACLQCKDGARKTVLIDSSGFWRHGRFVHTQCFTRDVTEKKRIETALLESEQRSRQLAAIVESSDDAIISKDLTGVITSWNKGAERLYGYSAEEIIGRSVTVLIPEDHYDEEPNILNRIRNGLRIDHYETVRCRKDGSLIDISLSVSPVRDIDGKIIGASKIARDITPQKRAERALQEAKLQLLQANEELESRVSERTASLREAVQQMEEFSYTVSHDLRAPLRAMQAYSDALIEDFQANLEPEAKRYLGRIADNASRLDRMILDILTYSRVARSEIAMQPVSLNKLVGVIIENYPNMQPPHAQIDAKHLDDVRGHEPSLMQAICNLLTNAVKFARPGIMPLVRIWTERHDGEIVLSIEDNGIGIDPKHQHRLFEMFERIHPASKYDGTGVGLAIARKAVQRMGGKIGVESDGINGSRFWIQLKAVQVQT
jgi:PAS domain S-box-containing protein